MILPLPSRRLLAAAVQATLPALFALLLALFCAGLLVLGYGRSPALVYRLLGAGTWGNPYGLGQVLFKATPLVFTGLAVALPMRAGLFNIGAEGQLALGAFATGLVGAYLPPWVPAPLALTAAIVAGFLAGAAAGAVPGALKAWRGAHEVIVTIMLNFVILAKLSDWGQRFYLRESVHTPPILAAAELPRASTLFPSLHGSALNASALLALLVALAVWWILFHTTVGFRLRAVGLGPDAAQTAGISVGRQQLLALSLGGGLAGLVGANAVLGYKHYYEQGFSGGIGFMGIAVALVGRNHPAGIVLAALLFGTLSQGGLAVNAVCPKEIVDLLEGVILVAVAAAAAWLATVERRRGIAVPVAEPPASAEEDAA